MRKLFCVSFQHGGHKGADINARNKYGYTALMLAAGSGRKDVVAVLEKAEQITPERVLNFIRQMPPKTVRRLRVMPPSLSETRAGVPHVPHYSRDTLTIPSESKISWTLGTVLGQNVL
jgi:hypothetical protein